MPYRLAMAQHLFHTSTILSLDKKGIFIYQSITVRKNVLSCFSFLKLKSILKSAYYSKRTSVTPKCFVAELY